jgi:hypothetical protein
VPSVPVPVLPRSPSFGKFGSCGVFGGGGGGGVCGGGGGGGGGGVGRQMRVLKTGTKGLVTKDGKLVRRVGTEVRTCQKRPTIIGKESYYRGK